MFKKLKEDRAQLIACKYSLNEPLTKKEEKLLKPWLESDGDTIIHSILKDMNDPDKDSPERKKRAEDSYRKFAEKYKDELAAAAVQQRGWHASLVRKRWVKRRRKRFIEKLLRRVSFNLLPRA